MTTFAIGRALSDAFGLMRRRPLSVLVWGALFVIPACTALALILPEFGDFMTIAVQMSATPGEPLPQPIMDRMARMQSVNLAMNFVQGVAMAVVYTAIMRAILRPAERSFFSLRLGMDEVRVAVVGIAIFVGLYIAMIVATIVGVIIGVFIYLSVKAAIVPVGLALFLALMIGFLFAMARLSLIAPTSILRRDFAFDEGWSLGKGRSGALFGLMLSVFGVLLLIEIVLFSIVAILFFSLVGLTPRAPFATGDNPFPHILAWVVSHWPVVAVGAVLASAFYGLVAVLAIAPFASACRQLTEGQAAPS
ncbi:hypothetical protein BH10PSE1_BH10PSE1_05040 [soil metagenome]